MNTSTLPNGAATGRLTARVISSPANEVAAKYERIAKMKQGRQAQLAQKRAEDDRRFQAEMAVPVVEIPVEYGLVRVGDVMFDRRYQTADRYNEGRARTIAREYRGFIEPIKINIRPGDDTETRWCYDGQHRTQAVRMKFGNDHPVPAAIIRVPYEREAELFAIQHDNVKSIPPTLRFNAELQAERPDAIERQAILDRLHLKGGRRASDHTLAINTFLECCRIKGTDATEAGLNIILDAWGGRGDSLESHMVKGVVWILSNRRDDPNWDEQRLRTVLGRQEVEKVEKLAGKKNDGLAYHQRVAGAIVDLCNANRKEAHCLKAWGDRNER